jgi:2-hydroxycyclohexanecarboxyl-CoA dehydrogenase
MTSRLTGLVAVVTGSGQGIGRGIAHALAKEGADLVLAGRTHTKVEKVAAEVRDHGIRAIALSCDVGVRAEVNAVVTTTIATFGRLDVLVNNAQSMNQRLLVETTDEDVELSWRTGALGTLFGMQAAFPYLSETKGLIVNFGSSTALQGDTHFGSYAMAKEAIRGLSRVAAREWGPLGIRVNVLVPTALSPAAEEFRERSPRRFAEVLRLTPLGRFGDPELDIGRAVVALAGGDLDYVTGATLQLDGGRVLLP